MSAIAGRLSAAPRRGSVARGIADGAVAHSVRQGDDTGVPSAGAPSSSPRTRERGGPGPARSNPGGQRAARRHPKYNASLPGAERGHLNGAFVRRQIMRWLRCGPRGIFGRSFTRRSAGRWDAGIAWPRGRGSAGCSRSDLPARAAGCAGGGRMGRAAPRRSPPCRGRLRVRGPSARGRRACSARAIRTRSWPQRCSTTYSRTPTPAAIRLHRGVHPAQTEKGAIASAGGHSTGSVNPPSTRSSCHVCTIGGSENHAGNNTPHGGWPVSGSEEGRPLRDGRRAHRAPAGRVHL
jgi:hypothetical protein